MVTDLALDDKNYTPALISWYEENRTNHAAAALRKRSDPHACAPPVLTWHRPAQTVTSLAAEMKGAPPPSLDAVAEQVARAFAAHFGYTDVS
jgi:hypothetical protein